MTKPDDARIVLSALNQAQTTLATRLKAYGDIYEKEGVQQFFLNYFKSGNQVLVSLLPGYVGLYRSLKIASQDDFETWLSKGHADTIMAKPIEQFVALEKNWDRFLLDVDQSMMLNQKFTPPDVKGPRVDVDSIRLTDCDSFRTATLRNYLNPRCGKFALFIMLRFYGCPHGLGQIKALQEQLDAFEKRLCNVAIVCKGTKEGGSKWRQLAGVSFPVLADESRDFVKALQFRQSVWNVCRAQNLHKMAQHTITQTIEERAHVVEDRIHDMYQLGGSVLLDAAGTILFLQRSKTSDDLPTVAQLLDAVPVAPSAQQNAKMLACKTSKSISKGAAPLRNRSRACEIM